MNYQKYSIKNVSNLLKLQSKWEKLEIGTDMTYYQSFSWNLICYKCLKKNRLASLTSEVVIYETDSIILPLVIQKISTRILGRGKRRGIYFLGDNAYSDYLNIIYDKTDEAEVEELIKIVKTDYKGKKLFLNNILDQSVLTKLKLANIKQHVETCVYVPICNNLDNYHSLLSKHTRQNIRTAQNRIDREGKEFQIEVIKGKLDDELIMQLKPIHFERMKIINECNDKTFSGKIISFFKIKNLENKEFKNNVIESAMRNESRSFTLLVKINSVIVGYLYGFDEKRIIRISQNCFKKEWAFYSPLFLGTYKLICSLIEQNIYKKIDFTRGVEEYKYKLGGEEQQIYLYEI